MKESSGECAAYKYYYSCNDFSYFFFLFTSLSPHSFHVCVLLHSNRCVRQNDYATAHCRLVLRAFWDRLQQTETTIQYKILCQMPIRKTRRKKNIQIRRGEREKAVRNAVKTIYTIFAQTQQQAMSSTRTRPTSKGTNDKMLFSLAWIDSCALYVLIVCLCGCRLWHSEAIQPNSRFILYAPVFVFVFVVRSSYCFANNTNSFLGKQTHSQLYFLLNYYDYYCVLSELNFPKCEMNGGDDDDGDGGGSTQRNWMFGTSFCCSAQRRWT